MSDERVIIITGAGQGIGAHAARSLAAKGHRIVIAELDETKGQQVASAISGDGGEALMVPTDVSDEVSVARMVERALERFGRITALVNNAMFGLMVPWDQVTVEQWQRTLAVNVIGPYLCARAVVPAMRAEGSGRIVNIASLQFFDPGRSVVPYIASKGAIVGLTRALATELGDDNITVNCIAPGLTRTEQAAAINPDEWFDVRAQQRALKRWMYPDDLVGAIDFFTSPASSFITGQTLVVDGGQHFH